MSTFNPIFYYNMIKISDPYLVNQVAHYPLNSNSNDVINAQNGSDTSVSYANAGVKGNCATFSGVSSYFDVADSNNFSFTNGSSNTPFSINFWFKIPSWSNALILNKRDTSNFEWQLVTESGTNLVFRWYSQNNISLPQSFTITNANTLLTVNNWHMITITGNGNNNSVNEVNIYINGGLRTITRPATGRLCMLNTTGILRAGRISGAIDGLRFWKNRELTSTEITNIYTTLY